jgi:type II secretion system protein H
MGGKDASGFTLIEVLAVIAIVGILAGVAAASFTGMRKKYDVDNQVRKMHADLSSVKIMAMTKGRMHFVRLSANGYTAYDDSDPAPDGNDVLTVGSDPVVLQSNQALNLSMVKSQEFLPISWTGGTDMAFSPRGLTDVSKTVCVFSDVNPRYDCINVSATRVTLGKLAVQGVCSAANCQIR